MNATLGVDNIRATHVAVPEPATVLLVGTGAASLIARRRRKARLG